MGPENSKGMLYRNVTPDMNKLSNIGSLNFNDYYDDYCKSGDIFVNVHVRLATLPKVTEKLARNIYVKMCVCVCNLGMSDEINPNHINCAIFLVM